MHNLPSSIALLAEWNTELLELFNSSEIGGPGLAIPKDFALFPESDELALASCWINNDCRKRSRREFAENIIVYWETVNMISDMLLILYIPSLMNIV